MSATAGIQIKAARTLTEMTRADLAEAASISESTVWQVEHKHRIKRPTPCLEKAVAALESAGVQFIPGGACLAALAAQEPIMNGAFGHA